MSNGNSGKPKVFKFTCVCNSNYPVFEGSWGIELEDETEFAYYQNLASDLTAALYAKLGQEFSLWRMDQDTDRLKAAVGEVSRTLGGTILD